MWFLRFQRKRGTGSTVLGAGFAATRDLVSFLRYDLADRNGMPNPMIAGDRRDDPPGAAHTLAFGDRLRFGTGILPNLFA
jgi:hypothetical protein